jgi:tungstate transport system ATP-binding protein
MRAGLAAVTRRYGDRDAVAGVGLTVASGGCLALLGPSGSGKTTLLRILDLLERPDAGEVRLEDRDPWTLPADARLALARTLGLVFQKPSIFQRSAADNVAYGMRLRGVPRAEARERARQTLDRVGLLALADQWAPTLSAGEAQRVAFARAVVLAPRLLLLDEFTANLDPGNVGLLERAVRDYRQGAGATVVLATHSFLQARRLADHVALILGGRLLAVGPTEEIFAHPPTEEAERFLSGELPW